MLDVGLLACMSRLDQSALLNGNELFIVFKGALTEQYVLQQLKTLSDTEVYYWTNDRGSAEVDFLLDAGNEVIPLK
jgi:predicted AAA+ superfamily ATPase